MEIVIPAPGLESEAPCWSSDLELPFPSRLLSGAVCVCHAVAPAVPGMSVALSSPLGARRGAEGAMRADVLTKKAPGASY